MTDEGRLLAQTERLSVDPRMRTLIGRAAFGEAAGRISGLDLRIHPGDQMLLHSLRHHGDANAAFSQYYNVALQQFRAAHSVMQLSFGEPPASLRVLDFACGFGRLLRFLRHALPVGNIVAAEVQEEALAFVHERFGIEVVPSAFDPQAFRPPGTFDVIWVASLFSHLPPRLFQAWLAHLLSLLGERGILCFSAHDVCLLPDAGQMPAEGVLYFPSSENPDLDTSSYGTTYVTEAYVQAAVRGALGGAFESWRIPRGLANEQDLYVVSRTGVRDLSALGAFRYGAWGWVDERRASAAEGLYLRGWAASLDDGPVEFVDISVDGRDYRCPTGGRRDDVAQVLADPRLATAGWTFTCPLPASGEDAIWVEVRAESSRGEVALLYAGRIVVTPAVVNEQAAAPPPRGALRGLLRRVFGR